MYLDRIKVKNFRNIGINDEVAQKGFSNQVNVIVGENGSGKTTLIEGIAALLGALTKNSENKSCFNSEVFEIDDDSVAIWEDFLEIKSTFFNKVKNDTRIHIKKEAGRGTEVKDVLIFNDINDYFFGFYSQDRLNSELDFEMIEGWFLEKNRPTNTILKKSQHEKELSRNMLKKISKILSDNIDAVDSVDLVNITDFHARVMVSVNGEQKPICHLSRGHKSIFGIVADMFIKMNSINKEVMHPELTKGICLIDDIDLHLHPKDQQKIMLSLAESFPNVQFIVSTHSPQVISTVKMEGVINVSEGLLKSFIGETYAQPSDYVMSYIQGVDPQPLFRGEISEIYRMIDHKKDFDDIEKKVDELSEKIQPNHREILMMRALISFKRAK